MSEAYLDPRRKHCCCTGSKLGDALCSLGYGSRKRYAEELLGLVAKKADNSYMATGRELEPWVAESYAAFTGNRVELKDFGLLPEDPRFGASPDYEVATPDGELFLLEIKTTSRDWEDEIDVGHMLQMLGQCRVFGHNKSHYARYHVRTGRFFIAEVTFEPELWEYVVYPKLCVFMDRIQRGQRYDERVYVEEQQAVITAVRHYSTVNAVVLH
jgi:hypothetical protein